MRRPLRDSSSASVTLNASTRVRRQGQGHVACPRTGRRGPAQMSPISLWSALDSESRPTSSKPENSSPSFTIWPIVVIDRSRTGRVIMPAWQNRQPRVQPRKISTAYRSCTVSASGTSGCFGYGQRRGPSWCACAPGTAPRPVRARPAGCGRPAGTSRRRTAVRTPPPCGPAGAAARRVPRAALAPSSPHDRADLQHRLLAVAEHRGVDEVGDRLRVEGGVPAGDARPGRRRCGRAPSSGMPARSAR